MEALINYLVSRGSQARGVMVTRISAPVVGMPNITLWEAHWTFDGIERANAYHANSRTEARNAAARAALEWLGELGI